MEIQLKILNKPLYEHLTEVNTATWFSRSKTYISDFMDEDIIASPIGNRLDRVILNNIQLKSKQDVDDLILFLKNVKESLIV